MTKETIDTWYKYNNQLYADFSENKIVVYFENGDITSYNLSTQKHGFVIKPKYYYFNGHSIIRIYDNKVVQSGL